MFCDWYFAAQEEQLACRYPNYIVDISGLAAQPASSVIAPMRARYFVGSIFCSSDEPFAKHVVILVLKLDNTPDTSWRMRL